MKILKAFSFTIFLFGFAGWVYIAVNAEVHPWTLSWQLTHLTPWIREDTFGIICFGLSFIACLVWRFLKESDKH